MNMFELSQTMAAIAALALILLGSAWLKRYLKGMLAA